MFNEYKVRTCLFLDIDRSLHTPESVNDLLDTIIIEEFRTLKFQLQRLQYKGSCINRIAKMSCAAGREDASFVRRVKNALLEVDDDFLDAVKSLSSDLEQFIFQN